MVHGSEIKPECRAYLLHLINEARQFPKLGLIGLVAVVGAELIIIVVLDASGREVAVERLEILVGSAWPAVQDQYLHRGMIADSLGPHAEGASGRVDRDQLDATAEDIVAARVVQVLCRNMVASAHTSLLCDVIVMKRVGSAALPRPLVHWAIIPGQV